MSFGLIWAVMLGAGLGLDRSLRDLRTGWFASGFSAALGYCAAWAFDVAGLADNRWAWPLAAAASSVAVGRYLAITTAAGRDRRRDDEQAAMAASAAFGLTFGFDGFLLVGCLALICIFTLAWRPLVEIPAIAAAAGPAPAPGPFSGDRFRSSANIVEIGRRSEEGGNDNEGGQQREEQRQGEQLAHAGSPGMAGQA